MDHGWRRRAAAWLERLVISIALLYLALHTLPRAWKTLNTDFPNYYMSSRLVHEGVDVARMYDWTWIEREKDHRDVDIRIIGLLPITPFSTLAMLPVAELAPLTAKHVWIALSLALLVPIVSMLRGLTGLTYQRVGLAFALCFPLHRNLEFGQYYVVLLFLIVAACWSYLRGRHVAAGALIAIAAACKVFPVLFLVFFLRRRAWKVLGGALLGLLAAAAISIAVFGWSVHWTYLQEILPWTLHGEAMPPYVPSASISGILHRLFLYEPQWNPHPWHSSVRWFAVLMPTLQMLVLAPAVLLIRRGEASRQRVLLELSALLTASLAISTVPALYNFLLLALPVCVLLSALLEKKRYGQVFFLMALYLCIGLPLPSPEKMMGLTTVLLPIARLPLLLALLLWNYLLLWRGARLRAKRERVTDYAWAGALLAALVVNVVSTLHRERAMRAEFAYRLPLGGQGFLNAEARTVQQGVHYVAFTYAGYHLVTERSGRVETQDLKTAPDDLSFSSAQDASGREMLLVESAHAPHSEIIDVEHGAKVVVEDARDPMLSADGSELAFVRDVLGRGSMRVRPAFGDISMQDEALTPPSLDVYEGSFVSDKEYAFSAARTGRAPTIYLMDATHHNEALPLGETRYPAISPDGQWMAYSRFEGGVWNLWLRDQKTGATHRIADVPCNQIQPAWQADAKTLLYSTDCGRSLWFTAVSRRRVLP